ncbi:MAG: hypothetical protein COV01_00710 [Candidatus Taylorbacteria bacterium CG10_big_fil_rev_8_21_14_0_10_41_48]|uniref:Uncharacterized protein n=1 Tax=Candidatus Taylorbacteria bacterium CG10_big_fil_rev_8_21_14_0_10_41_48 TaxID=1975024 RepID=A0A2M8LDB9_9BACT|nr:MAG: hypothetical protein COV01_00710 [Candidatus Taylorbacteria bacterium CG10_big_fil_rev_8_21_14_0_10_41_48]
MFNIGDYLKKFSTIGAEAIILNNTIKKIISDKTGTPEDLILISIKGSVVYITTDRSTKNLIFISKLEIIETLSKNNLRKKITDIR